MPSSPRRRRSSMTSPRLFAPGELANALPTYTHPAVLVVD
jgi:hypothetical protein